MLINWVFYIILKIAEVTSRYFCIWIATRNNRSWRWRVETEPGKEPPLWVPLTLACRSPLTSTPRPHVTWSRVCVVFPRAATSDPSKLHYYTLDVQLRRCVGRKSWEASAVVQDVAAGAGGATARRRLVWTPRALIHTTCVSTLLQATSFFFQFQLLLYIRTGSVFYAWKRIFIQQQGVYLTD